jgi:GNAT superfamily N-acetyltransferase
MNIYEAEQYQVNDPSMHRAFDLWWSDFEEAGIERLWLAEDDEGDVVGFLTANGDGHCVAIEVIESAQGRGIARALVEESNCWKPDRDECPEFWAKMAEEFGGA